MEKILVVVRSLDNCASVILTKDNTYEMNLVMASQIKGFSVYLSLIVSEKPETINILICKKDRNSRYLRTSHDL